LARRRFGEVGQAQLMRSAINESFHAVVGPSMSDECYRPL
jgi:hypothetical protein